MKSNELIACSHSVLSEGNEAIPCETRSPVDIITPNASRTSQLNTPEQRLRDEHNSDEGTTMIDLTGNSPGVVDISVHSPPSAIEATEDVRTAGGWSCDSGEVSDRTDVHGEGVVREGHAQEGRCHTNTHGPMGSTGHGVDPAERGGEKGDPGEDDSVQVQCPVCTFNNPPSMDLCQMCVHPLRIGLAGRVLHVQHGRVGGGGRGRESGCGGAGDEDLPALWTCPLCTFCGNRRGNWVCQACEMGRPRRQDMLDAESEEGYLMVSEGTVRGRAGRPGPRGRSPARAGGRVADTSMQTLEDVVRGALLGSGVAGVGSAVAGGSRSEHRRRAFIGGVVGGLGAGLLGGYMRRMREEGDAIDSMSYDDLLSLFGPGHEPIKATAATVCALPEITVQAADVARMRRESINDTHGCSICMEDFAEGDVTRRLPCLHMYHKECIDRWLLQCNATCPICKAPCG